MTIENTILSEMKKKHEKDIFRVFVSRDFYGMPSPASADSDRRLTKKQVSAALASLADSGWITRIGHGYYTLPQTTIYEESLMRAYEIKNLAMAMFDGSVPAADFGIRGPSIPRKDMWMVSGASGKIRVENRTFLLHHAPEKLLQWGWYEGTKQKNAGKTVRILYWLGQKRTMESEDHVTKNLKLNLSEYDRHYLKVNLGMNGVYSKSTWYPTKWIHDFIRDRILDENDDSLLSATVPDIQVLVSESELSSSGKGFG